MGKTSKGTKEKRANKLKTGETFPRLLSPKGNPVTSVAATVAATKVDRG